jgi:hypothetical protein
MSTKDEKDNDILVLRNVAMNSERLSLGFPLIHLYISGQVQSPTALRPGKESQLPLDVSYP